MKTPLLICAGTIIAVAAFVSVAFQKQIGMRLYDRFAMERISRSLVADLPDGLHVGVCGSASPMPDPNRAGPCNFVIAGKQLIMIDAGSSGVRRMALMGASAGDISAILLTHVHSDHIDGLGEAILQSWVTKGRSRPLLILGPQGTERVVNGFNEAYAVDATFRTAHHGDAVAPESGFGGISREIELNESVGQSVILDTDGLKVTAFLVQHEPVAPAFGFRFDYRGRSVVISGDTKYSDRLVEVAKGADLLFHEAQQDKMVAILGAAARAAGDDVLAKISEDILTYHTTPEDAARAADAAGVSQLVLTHLTPPIPLRYLYRAFLGDAPRIFGKKIVIAEDGMLFSLPPDDTHIAMSRKM